MQDNDSGSERQGSWQPPEYVSPWTSATSAGDGSDTGPEQGASDTIAFGPQSRQPWYQQQEPAQPGYQQPAYQQPWFGQPRFSYGNEQGAAGSAEAPGVPGVPGYGPPPPQGGYGAWGGGPGDQFQWGGYGAPPPPQGSRLGRFLAYVAVAALAAGAGAGAAIALNHTSSTPSSASAPTNTNPGGGGIQQNPFNNGNNGFGGNGFGNGGGGNGGQNGQGGSNAGTGSLNAQALAKKVDPGIVDVTSQLKYNNATAEGTGMVISPSGLVLTNNHVIDQATSVSATLVVSGKTYIARVVGYDSTDDVALLQLEGASGLKTVSLGDSSAVKVGQAVLALGNAGGRGGLPSTAQGTVNGLNRTIQASDNGAGTEETLHGMLETNAPIEEGDSGGPLVNSAGKVIGMDTAANTANGIVQYQPAGATTGFAIPINHAVSIVNQIAAGHASGTVHLGLSGFIGINVADADVGCSDGFGGGFGAPVNSGAEICKVFDGTPAAAAGLANGDVITSIDGHNVTSANALTTLMAGDHPGEHLSISYVDPNGGKHTTSVTLGAVAK